MSSMNVMSSPKGGTIDVNGNVGEIGKIGSNFAL